MAGSPCTFEYPQELMQQLPAYDTHNIRENLHLMTQYHD